MKRLRDRMLAAHILLWVLLAGAASATAGSFSLSSCWHIVLFFVPPLGMLVLAIAGFSLITLLIAIGRPIIRAGVAFLLASHGLVLTAGLAGCVFAAHAAAGRVSCL